VVREVVVVVDGKSYKVEWDGKKGKLWYDDYLHIIRCDSLKELEEQVRILIRSLMRKKRGDESG